MPFPKQIQDALENYDLNKSWIRKIMGDPSSIKRLRQLKEFDHDNLFAILNCFKSEPDLNSAHHQVYNATLKECTVNSLDHMTLLSNLVHIKVLTQDNFISFAQHPDPKTLIKLIRQLHLHQFYNSHGNDCSYVPFVTLIEVIDNAQNSEDIVKSISRLVEFPQLFTTDILAMLSKNQAPVDLAELFLTLLNRGLVNNKNMKVIKSHISFDFLDALKYLDSVEILTQKTFDLLNNKDYIGKLADSLEILEGIEKLDEITFHELIDLYNKKASDKDISAYLDRHKNNKGLNIRESTHLTSVHKSSSDSANRLMNRYGKSLVDKDYDRIIGELNQFVNQLEPNHKNDAAKRCMKRLLPHSNRELLNYEDPVSKINNKKLFGLAWIAISDDLTRVVSLKEARMILVDGLYEMQRNKNISQAGIDNGLKIDKMPSCAGGIFNKIIEKLVSLNNTDDCQIIMLDIELAILKLKRVIRAEVLEHLSKVKRQKSPNEFKKYFADFKEDGFDVFFNQVQEQISERIFEEFNPLFKNKTDPEFTNFIDSGRYIELKFLDKEYPPEETISIQNNGFFQPGVDGANKKAGHAPSPRPPNN